MMDVKTQWAGISVCRCWVKNGLIVWGRVKCLTSEDYLVRSTLIVKIGAFVVLTTMAVVKGQMETLEICRLFGLYWSLKITKICCSCDCQSMSPPPKTRDLIFLWLLPCWSVDYTKDCNTRALKMTQWNNLNVCHSKVWCVSLFFY